MACAVRSGPHRDADEWNCPSFLLQSEEITINLCQLYAGVSEALYSLLKLISIVSPLTKTLKKIPPTRLF